MTPRALQVASERTVTRGSPLVRRTQRRCACRRSTQRPRQAGRARHRCCAIPQRARILGRAHAATSRSDVPTGAITGRDERRLEARQTRGVDRVRVCCVSHSERGLVGGTPAARSARWRCWPRSLAARGHEVSLVVPGYEGEVRTVAGVRLISGWRKRQGGPRPALRHVSCPDALPDPARTSGGRLLRARPRPLHAGRHAGGAACRRGVAPRPGQRQRPPRRQGASAVRARCRARSRRSRAGPSTRTSAAARSTQRTGSSPSTRARARCARAWACDIC